MISTFRTFASLVIAAVLAGCAAGVTRMDAAPGLAPAAAPAAVPDIKAVSLWLNDEAKKLVADNLKFNQDALRSMVERALAANSLIKPESGHTLDIEITSIRARSNFSAVMFGFMAGNDHIEGVVTIKDTAGKVLKRGKVSASYALGGLAGGQDDARMGWLYETFSKHTVAEVTGNPVK
jgi:hypothetical protein